MYTILVFAEKVCAALLLLLPLLAETVGALHLDHTKGTWNTSIHTFKMVNLC